MPILLLLTVLQVCTAQKEAKIMPFSPLGELGTSVDIQADRMIVGAPKELSPLGGYRGAVRVYERVGGVWIYNGVLADSMGGGLEDGSPYFGSAISLDGDQVAVGGAGIGFNFNSVAGETPDAHGLVWVFVKQATTWVQEAMIVPTEQEYGLGFAVDIEGDVLLVGSPLPSFGGSAKFASKAFIFVRTPAGWKKQWTLQPLINNAPGQDRFGFSVLLRGDTAFIGSPGNAGTPWLSAGYVSVYKRIGSIGKWILQQNIVPDDSHHGDFFGCSLAMHGDTLVIGSRNSHDPVTADSGGAYVFRRNGGVWAQEAKLVPQGRTFSCNGGWSVALHGDRLAVGAPNGFGAEGGAAFLYSRFGKQWVEISKLSPFKGNADGFGLSMALHGDSLVVGAPLDDSPLPDGGTAYVYRIKNGNLPPAYYCTGKTVSGKTFGPCSPRIFAVGEPSISGAAAGEKHDVWALEVRPKVKGMLAYSISGPAQLPFAGGTLCVKAPITRTPLQTSTSYFTGTECHGYFKFDFSAWMKSGVDPALQAGRQVWFQYWYREPSFAAPNVGLTGAMTALICQ